MDNPREPDSLLFSPVTGHLMQKKIVFIQEMVICGTIL